jgi:hypothetical protein
MFIFTSPGQESRLDESGPCRPIAARKGERRTASGKRL